MDVAVDHAWKGQWCQAWLELWLRLSPHLTKLLHIELRRHWGLYH